MGTERFDFISDRELRRSLEADMTELDGCMSVGAWKAVHVLSGSIVEALLVDYLQGTKTDGDPLKMDLGALIRAAKAAGVLTQKSADLSSVVRDYRNLIHPGRVKRLGEEVNEEGAAIAKSLIALVTREVAAKQAQVHGLTADQLLSKFESDPSAAGISLHLLRDARQEELERLLTEALPERLLSVITEIEGMESDLPVIGRSAVLGRLQRLYVDAYMSAPRDVQEMVGKKYVQVLREDAGWRVSNYEEWLLLGRFLAHLNEQERVMVKEHLLSRIGESGQLTPALISGFAGLSGYASGWPECQLLMNALVRTIAYSKEAVTVGLAEARLVSEYEHELNEDMRKELRRWLGVWVSFLEEKKRVGEAERVKAVVKKLELLEAEPF